MIKVLSLFSGIGAFEQALKNLRIPFELIGYCEIDKYASKSYSAIHNVSETINLGDITKHKNWNITEKVDLITYGFPCQDISVAGKRQGLMNVDGTPTRSGLFFEALEIIETYKPKIAIAKNVKNLIGKKFTEQFKIILDALNDAGYNNYYQVLNAKDFGVPQSRERVFIVSIRKDIDRGIFEFPTPYPLKLRLKDVLEKDVDEKFYMQADKIQSIIENLKNTQQDAMIANEPVRLGGIYDGETKHQAGSVWDINTISPTLDTMQGGNRQPMIVEESLIYDDYNNRIKANQDAIGTLTPNFGSSSLRTGTKIIEIVSSDDEPKIIEDFYANRPVREYVEASPTIRSERIGLKVVNGLRVRKLTPKECFRLMGFSDDAYFAAEKVNSNTQLYKQAGNSIVVDVLEELFCMMFDEDGEIYV